MAANELSGAVHQLSSRRISSAMHTRKTQLGDLPETVQVTQPADQWVPTGAGLGHQLQVVDSASLESLVPRNLIAGDDLQSEPRVPTSA